MRIKTIPRILPLATLLTERHLGLLYRKEHADKLKLLLKRMPYDQACLRFMETEEQRTWLRKVVREGLLPRPYIAYRYVTHPVCEATLEQCLLEGDFNVECCDLIKCTLKGRLYLFECHLSGCDGSLEGLHFYYGWAQDLHVEAQEVEMSASYIHSGRIKAKVLHLGHYSRLGDVKLSVERITEGR